MTDDKIKEAFEEWWKRHQLKESSLDSDDAMYCFKYGYKAGLKEELQDKNNKLTKEDYELSTTKETLQDAIGALEGVMIDANESWCTCSSEEGDGCYYHDAIEILYKIKGSK